MLDRKFVRGNPDLVKKAMSDKNESADLDELLRRDEQRRALLVKVDTLKKQRNDVSQEIGRLKASGEQEEAETRIREMRKVSDEITDLDEALKGIDEALHEIEIRIPNIPHPSVPVGVDESANQTVRTWGERPTFPFEPLPHWELGDGLGLMDFQAASNVAGSGFALLKGRGARLQRALVQFMLDLHVREHGYVEVAPPYLANRETMFGTGQLPKLEEDMYFCEVDDLFLIPTAEVPVTNLHRNETLAERDLPIQYVAHTACFRREAGAHGKETRGMVRVHQFEKVELVKFVRPEDSYDELESLTANAETVLQRLGLAYRVVMLSTGDLSFAAAKCYDLELWGPAQRKWLEVSSCSNFEDFQARRIGIRYKPAGGGKARLVHTLNGSGVALPRLIVALLENYQREDGSVEIPEALVPYVDGMKEIK
ncbi:MAG: serine--tRNA ligase [Candidatus Eisenbacteria sp.]|nr:serine--tRNA ligase [Candidatus Eisenbacteria bacterium]